LKVFLRVSPIVHLRLCSTYDPFVLLFSLVVRTNCTNQLYKKIVGQFNERLLLWQPSGMFFLYSTVIILIRFMFCLRIKMILDIGGGGWRPIAL